jgi:D-tyrosyl-tRNA(Tyr) deacylase
LVRAVAQRVSSARVEVDGEVVGRIEAGLLVYLGAGREDSAADVAYTAAKLAGLRVFEDEQGKMSLSVADVGGQVLVVSQFTLYGDMRKGRRPSFTHAAEPGVAAELCERVVVHLREGGLHVETGRFRATMDVHAVVAGPVTILIDSNKDF